jgi:hypothetical protein
LLRSTVQIPATAPHLVQPTAIEALYATWSACSRAGIEVLQRRASEMSRPVGGDEYPGGIRELSLLLESDETGAPCLYYVYWQQKRIHERFGRRVRLDEEGKFIFDTSGKVRSWVTSEVILPGARCTMIKGRKELRESPPIWVSQLKHMCEVAIGNSASAVSEGGRHDEFTKCQKCRQEVREGGTAEVVFTCSLCLRSLHPSCCSEVLATCSDTLLEMRSPLTEITSIPSPFADHLAEPQCLSVTNRV